MAITTLKGHVSRAMDFYNKSDAYFVLGKTSAWTDENDPPSPVPTDDITEVSGYKHIESNYMVVPDNTNGTIVYRDTKWRIVPYGQALTEGARWVYVSSFVSYEELPLDPYRQVGITTGLVREPSASPGKANLLPSEVSDPGILEVLDNRRPVYRQADQREQLSVIIEF